MIAKPTPRYITRLIDRRHREQESRRVRAEVKARDRGRCRCCGSPGTDLHHVLYRSHGGKDTTDNMVTVCRDCHRAIHGHALRVHGSDAASVVFEWHPEARKAGLR